MDHFATPKHSLSMKFREQTSPQLNKLRISQRAGVSKHVSGDSEKEQKIFSILPNYELLPTKQAAKRKVRTTHRKKWGERARALTVSAPYLLP